MEFFTYGPNNEKILVNANNPNAVKAYTKAAGGPPVTPTVSIVTVAGGNVVITYSGTLQSTDSLSSPNWQNVGGSSPLTTGANGTQKYYRAVGQ